MSYLVTGGAGFIGSNLVEALLARGEHVRVLDNFSTGKRENLAPFASHKHLEVVEGDIRAYHTVRGAVEGIDVVLHEAALPSVPRSVRDPLSSDEVNVHGTLNLLHAAREVKSVRRFVFASSSSVYGDTPELPKHEGMLPTPRSPYAVSKIAGEYYCRVYGSLYGLETVALRYFNVFGPRQDPTSQYSAVIPKFITAMLRGEQPVIYGDGEQSRDFTYIQNVVEANLAAATSGAVRAGSFMNCACHGQVSLNDLVRLLNGILQTGINPRYAPERAGDVKHSFASIDKMRQELCYDPTVSFEEGLRRTCEHYRSAMG